METAQGHTHTGKAWTAIQIFLLIVELIFKINCSLFFFSFGPKEYILLYDYSFPNAYEIRQFSAILVINL